MLLSAPHWLAPYQELRAPKPLANSCEKDYCIGKNNHIDINTKTADSHVPALVRYIETRAE